MIFERIRTIFSAAFIAAFFCACAQVPTVPEEAAARFAEREPVLVSLTHWQVAGRVGVRTSQGGGSLALVWRRAPEAQTLDFANPLGKRVLRVEENAHGAQAIDAQQRRYEGTDVERLLAETLDMQVPLKGLAYWIRGLPLPEVQAQWSFDRFGRLRRLAQLGWDIEFLDYVRVNDLDLPAKIFLRYGDAAPANAALQLRLVINEWTLNP